MTEQEIAKLLLKTEEVEIGELCQSHGVVCARTEDTSGGQVTSAAVIGFTGEIVNRHCLRASAEARLEQLLNA